MINYILANEYLWPMIMAIGVAMVGALLAMPRKEKIAEKNVVFVDEVEKPFDNYISNMLYEFSFKPPFVWFCVEDPEHEKAKERNAIIAKARLTKKMDYRVFQTMQLCLFLIAFLAAMVLSTIFDNSQALIKLLFNVETSGDIPTFIIMLGITFVAALIPNIYIKTRADSKHSKFISDLPVLQLFIILMIRSNRTIPEIFYVLSKSEMQYTDIFANAYRILLRDRQQAFTYLRGAFHGTPILDSLTVLETFDEYSKEDSATILQNQLANIVDDVAILKKNKNVMLGLINEGSIALPFIAIMLLGVVPIVFYGLGMMNSATNSGMDLAAQAA